MRPESGAPGRRKRLSEAAPPPARKRGEFESEARLRAIVDSAVDGIFTIDEVPLGDRRLFAGIVRDVTGRKRIEEERQKFVSLVENSGDFIAVASLQWQTTYLNKAAQELIGVPQRRLQHLRHPRSAERDVTPTQQLFLRWVERDGPPLTPPRQSGFGRRLLERGPAFELRGKVQLDFAPEGRRCTIMAALDGLADPPLVPL